MVTRRAFDDLKFHVGVLREKRLEKLAWSAARDRRDYPDAQAALLTDALQRSREEQTLHVVEDISPARQDANPRERWLRATTLPLE